MESELNQNKEKARSKVYNQSRFLQYLKERLVSYTDLETERVYVGHVAMYYHDTGRIRIDWDNGATTYHNFNEESKWLFKKVNSGS